MRSLGRERGKDGSVKRLIVFLLFAAAIWYGWKHYPELLHRQASHDAVIENQTDGEIDRVRLKIGDQTLVKETLAAGERATLPFRVNQDATFELTWTARDGDHSWSGGMVPAGPMVQRHEFLIDPEGQVMYRAENK
jgi:hypothetical protein